jgi:hypothetical protein
MPLGSIPSTEKKKQKNFYVHTLGPVILLCELYDTEITWDINNTLHAKMFPVALFLTVDKWERNYMYNRKTPVNYGRNQYSHLKCL